MKVKLFTLYLDTPPSQSGGGINEFMENVKVEKVATQFVPCDSDYWSVLVFYSELPVQVDQAGTLGAETGSQVDTGRRTEADLITDDQKSMYAALRLWRKDRAQELNLPEFMVQHNAYLINTVLNKPTDLIGLSKLKGWGEKKLQKFGDDVIAILNAF